MADLKACQTDEFYIVFDDMHLLKGHDASLSFIDHLFETAPPWIHFIFSSREPVLTVAGRLKESSMRALLLNNDDLAMSESEVVELYNSILKTLLPRRTLANIHRATDGWAMGVVMIGHHLEAYPDDSSWAAHTPAPQGGGERRW
ncbi:MAG: helix-turn-helix transcriptional regulator [Thermodesulfobacteriota bacterium]